MRRRPKVVWLPPDKYNGLGQSPGTPATVGLQNGVKQIVWAVPGGTGSSHTELVPLVQDGSLDSLLLISGTLADYAQSAYRLRRIVGKILIGCQQNATGNLPTEVVVTAGIIVLRTKNEAGAVVPLNNLTEEYSTQMLQNWSDPWIWRRTWVLSNLPLVFTLDDREVYPETNSAYGSVADGPHVDAKTARVIGPEERLYLVLTASSVGGDPQASLTLRTYVDLRVLASMRSSQGNRRNASR